MRTSIVKIVFLFSLLSTCGLSFAGLAEHEATCAELGFKKKTQAYGECVLELDQREITERTLAIKQAQQQAQQQAQIQAQQKGDGTNEHQMCVKFGFVVGSAPYSDCRLKIDIAKREQAHRQAAYEIEMKRYQEEQRRYEAQVAEYEKEKERQKGLALMRFGAALAGGTSPYFSENLANAGRQSLGLAPNPPTRPQIQNFTITNPVANRVTNCTMVGNNINCY
jgi:hypothetical protein